MAILVQAVCINLKCINPRLHFKMKCHIKFTLFSSQFRLHVTVHCQMGRSQFGSTLFSKEELVIFTQHDVGLFKSNHCLP